MHDYDKWDELQQTFAWMGVEPHEVLEDYKCPFCGDGFMSNEMITCGTFPNDMNDKFIFFAHTGCMTKEREDTLERVGYSLCTDTGAEME